MIHPLAFANALALTTAALALMLWILRALTPHAFVFVFNAQFFGANVASLLPPAPSVWTAGAEMLAFVGGAWGFGVLGAVLYNHLITPRGRR